MSNANMNTSNAPQQAAVLKNLDEVRAMIGETLIHEVGHYFGLSEEEIEEIEEHYWRGETGPEEED